MDLMISVAAVLSILFAFINSVHGHGYMQSPRSRNFVAYEDGLWWGGSANHPEKENCPHCLNLGGTSARCGLTSNRNYDSPKNALNDPMSINIQASYEEGSEVQIDIILTAHHKGHFTYKACPISPGEVPQQSCFDNNPLEFVSDVLYGAVKDPNYPERAYIAPSNVPEAVFDGSGVHGMKFSHKFKLPQGLTGDLVLIQWHYLTANSCKHPGYEDYPFPWSDSIDSVSLCGNIPPDGNGVPEQFWNCAEVEITPSDGGPTASKSPSLEPINVPTLAPIIATSAPSSVYLSQAPTPSAITRRPIGSNINKTRIGYYASWQWYDRDYLAKPENMDFSKVDRINFAFFQTDIHGNLWGTDSWADPQVLFGPQNWNPPPNGPKYCSWDSPTGKNCHSRYIEKGLISLAHNAGAEVYPSLGGWSLSDAFPAMAASASSRVNFANKCVELIQDYGFDGIDIDWEYPGYEDHSGTSADKQNFNLLLTEVRSKLDLLSSTTGKDYGLTAALPCGPNHIHNIDVPYVSNVLSELNLMTYDLNGAWDSVTGINSPLYYQGWGNPEFNVDQCVKNWIEAGASSSTINIGLPFYGRSFADASGLNKPHRGVDNSNWGIDEGVPQYFNILENLHSMTSVRHERTKTQYAYFDNGSGFVSFDDEHAICDKTDYVIKNDLNGFIIWELSGDMKSDLSTPLLDILNGKLENPNLECDSSKRTNCGGGTVGNGICVDGSCCSEFGWCGNSPEHCATSAPVPAPKSKAPSNEPMPSPTRLPSLSSAPTASPPNSDPFCNVGYTGLKPFKECTKFYHCVNGVVVGNPIPCASGTLFDENLQVCNWAYLVSCQNTKTLTQSPSRSPTHSPSSSPSSSPTRSPSSSPSMSPTKMPSLKTTKTPSDSPVILSCKERKRSRFLLKKKKRDQVKIPVTKNCSWLQKLNKKKRKEICQKRASFGGYEPAKSVCIKTCNNCPT